MGLSIDRGFGPNGGSNAESMPTNQTSSGIAMSSQSNITNATPLTTSQRQQKKVFQQHKGGSMSQTGFIANDNNEATKMGSKGSGLFGISGFGNNASEKNPQSTVMQSVNQSISGNKVPRSMVPSTSSSISSNNPKVPASGAGIRMPVTENVAPNSLMLWKKVQHYVVVGGAFVQAGQQASSSGGNNQANIQPQHHPVNNIVPTANQSSLHQ